MTDDATKLKAIYRYPVKGLSAEPLAHVRLATGATLPCDRLYAIENGPSGFDPAAPRYLPKSRFLMLMRNARLAELRTAFDEANHVLSVHSGGHEAVRGDLRDAEGRAAIERFFANFCAADLRGAPRILHAQGHSFSDVARKVVSIVNLASVQEIEEAAGMPIDPLRFRANLHVEGWTPWAEFDAIGREIAIGPTARLRVVKRIVRCAATEVDPQTARRDLDVPHLLMQRFGHMDCGVYAEVLCDSDIAIGDAISTVGVRAVNPEDGQQSRDCR